MIGKEGVYLYWQSIHATNTGTQYGQPIPNKAIPNVSTIRYLVRYEISGSHLSSSPHSFFNQCSSQKILKNRAQLLEEISDKNFTKNNLTSKKLHSQYEETLLNTLHHKQSKLNTKQGDFLLKIFKLRWRTTWAYFYQNFTNLSHSLKIFVKIEGFVTRSEKYTQQSAHVNLENSDLRTKMKKNRWKVGFLQEHHFCHKIFKSSAIKCRIFTSNQHGLFKASSKLWYQLLVPFPSKNTLN